jgi:MFS family permease
MTDAQVAIDRLALSRWRRAIMAAFGLGGITVTAWGPRLPAVKAELGISTATIGLLLAGVTVGAITGLVVSTPVLHRLGSRGGVAASLLVVAGAVAVMGVGLTLRSVPLVGVAFVLVGLGIGTLDVLINVDGSAIERAAGRTLMPLMHGAWSIGAAVGSGIGAACAALGVTPPVQFIGEAAIIGAAAFAMAPAIPTGDHRRDARQTEARLARVRQWLRGWTDWRLLLVGVVMLGVELGEGSANNWLTLAVRNDHGQTAAIAALFLTAFAIGEALARVFGGRVVDWLGRVQVIRYTTALGVLGLLLFILVDDLWAVLVGVLLWAVGVSMGFPLGMSAAAESGPDPAARVSVVASIGYFANLAGPPVIGAVAEEVGLLNALWIVVALFLAAFAVAGSLGRPQASGSSTPSARSGA